MVPVAVHYPDLCIGTKQGNKEAIEVLFYWPISVAIGPGQKAYWLTRTFMIDRVNRCEYSQVLSCAVIIISHQSLPFIVL
jgi:hypothetical protein